MGHILSFLCVVVMFFSLSLATAENQKNAADQGAGSAATLVDTMPLDPPLRQPSQTRISRDRFLVERIEDINGALVGYRWTDMDNKVVCYTSQQASSLNCLKQ